MTNVVKRLLYDEQKKWFNRNNWSIFQDHLLSKGATTYRYPSASNSGLDEKLSFLANENQINHFNANPSEIANNIMISRNGPQWEKVGQDIDGEAQDDNSGFSVSLSDDGSVMAIGAPYNGSDSGHVRIYQYGKNEDGNYGWHQLGETIQGESVDDFSGWSVSLSSDGFTVAIGADMYDGFRPGQVRVFEYREYIDDNDNGKIVMTAPEENSPTDENLYWIQKGDDIDGEEVLDQYGYSVSLSADGSVVAIGAAQQEFNQKKGYVRIFKYSIKDGNTDYSWNKLGSDIVGDDSNKQFGDSISLSADGTVLAIGDGLGDDVRSGRVRVYKYRLNDEEESPDWHPLGLNIEGEAELDYSGKAVSLSADGSVLAIGARLNNPDPEQSQVKAGHVRVYKYRKYRDEDNNNDGTSKFNYTSTVVNDEQTKPIMILESTDETSPTVGNFYWMQLGLDIDGDSDDHDDVPGQGTEYFSGLSLSNDGFIVAIGNPFTDTNGANLGQVRIYQYDPSKTQEDRNGPTGWNRVGQDIYGESVSDLSGSSVSLSADGSVLAIGAINNDGNGHNSGHVRVFQIAKRNSWVQQGLNIVDNDADDESGHSVSLNGDGSMLAIGSYAHNSNRGKVDVYVYENSKWNSDLSLSSIDGYFYGFSVSLSKSGSVLAVSSEAWKGATGKVDILEKQENGDWDQLGNSIEGDNLVDKSGWSVSCVDGRENNKPLLVAIGAIGNNGNGSESGRVRVYEYDINSSKEDNPNSPNYGPDGWKRVGQDIYGKAAGYESGYSVSLSADGSTLAIGAPNPKLKPDLISHVRIFHLVEGEWEQQGGDIEEESSSNVSGWSVSLSGDGSRVAIGAPGNHGDSDSTDDYRGHVRVYQRDPDSPNEEDQSSPDYGPTGWKRVGQDIDGEDAGDLSGHSVSLSEDGKILAIGANISDLIPYKAGYTRVYRCDVNNEWVRLGFNFEGELGDESSWSISLSGDGKMLAIGSRKSSGSILNSNENTGHVRVYKSAGWGLGTE